MRVKELIDKLNNFSPDALVTVTHGKDNPLTDYSEVEDAF